MIAAGSSGGLAGLIAITGLLVWIIGVWLLVLVVRFLRSVRKACDRYLDLTDPSFPRPPGQPPAFSPDTDAGTAQHGRQVPRWGAGTGS